MTQRNPYVQYMYSYPHKTAYRPLEGVDLRDYGDRFAGPGHGLYFHVPFCQSKCGYCNLFSVTGTGEEVMERYLDCVERQLGQYAPIMEEAGAVFSDFTVGGGTPLILSEKQLERAFHMVDQYLKLEQDRQIIVETAPNQTTKEKLRLLKEQNVTRVSMGIQSFREQELKTLRRGHSGDRARRGLELLRSFDFPCVNVDFIYGIPGQTVDSLLSSLKEAVNFRPEEIFLYPLYVKHGAAMERDLREGMVLEPERAYEQYREASAYLMSEGFCQDSMRRFVRTRRGWEDRSSGAGGEHSGRAPMARGKSREFSDCGSSSSLALGCGGRSYAGNLHFCTPYAITRDSCMEELKAFMREDRCTRISHGIFLSTEEEKRRYVIRHILIRPGLPRDQYQERFGKDVLEDFPLLLQWEEQGYLEKCHGAQNLTLTPAGLGLSDWLGPQLISEEIRQKMEEWDHVHREDHGSLQGEPKKL